MRAARWLVVTAIMGVLAAPIAHASGWAAVQEKLTDSSVKTLLPAGSVTVNMNSGISIRLLAADSSGNFKSDSQTFFTYDAGAGQTCRTTSIVPASSEFKLCLETDGGVTIQRIAGPTIEVIMRIMWITQPS